MSTAIAPAGDGPELAALRYTRRWLMVAVAVLLAVVALVSAGRYWGELATAERLVVSLGIALIAVGAALSARMPFLWVMVAGMWCLSAVPLVAQPGSPPWLALPTALTYSVYAVVLLLDRWTGMIVCVVAGAAVVATWALRPASLVVISSPVLDGWVAMAQIVVGWFCLWWAWTILFRESLAADRLLRRQEETTERALALQQRAALWRAAATRVHESVLNTIRYVLGARELDRGALSRAVADDVVVTEALGLATAPTVHDLMGALTSEAGIGDVVRVRGPVPVAGLDPAVYRAVRAAGLELVRNAVRHGQADTVVVEPRLGGDGTLVLRVTDSGRGLPPDTRPGIGLRTVLEGELSAVNGRWALAGAPEGGVAATIVVPHVRASTLPPGGGPATVPAYDRGRFLVTAAIAGNIAVGSIYFVALARAGDAAANVAAVLGLLGCIAAVSVVVARRHVRAGLGVLLVLAPALVPWVLQSGQNAACVDVAFVAPAFNLAGIVVITVATWTRLLPGAVGAATWAAGGLLLAATVPEPCRAPVELAFVNALIVLPVLLAVAFIGMRTAERTRGRTRSAREREIAELTRAEAAIDLNVMLNDAVRDAVSTLREVAAGAPVDQATRHRLELADGRIRAAIQVDLKHAGAFAVLARRLVDSAADAGVPIHVRAIACSSDARPCPPPVETMLSLLVREDAEPAPVLQVFSDGVEDHLSLTVSGIALAAAGVIPGESRRLDDVVVEVEERDLDADPASRLGVLVSRPVVVADLGHEVTVGGATR